MTVILNRLETEKEIQTYKEQLTKKSIPTLYRFIRYIKLDNDRENKQYVNHQLRIKLINEEITKRLH